MENDIRDTVLAELDDLLGEWSSLGHGPRRADTARQHRARCAAFAAGALAVARRATGPAGEYVELIEDIIREVGWRGIDVAIPQIAGTLQALRAAVASGYLVTIGQLARADVFSDFLDMAQYLLDQRYKDAAAVLVRGVLESHLRELCGSNSIDTTYTDTRGKTVPKTVDTMNADLKRAGVYSTTEQKSVTWWYGLGTDAAHGNYNEYTSEEVKLALQGVRDFLARHPA